MISFRSGVAGFVALVATTISAATAQQYNEPVIAFSELKNQMYVNGFVFDVTDASAAMRSQDFLTRSPVPLPNDGALWIPITQSDYTRYILDKKNPTLQRQAAKILGINDGNTGGVLVGLGVAAGIVVSLLFMFIAGRKKRKTEG